MSQTITVRKGLDIRLKGEAEKIFKDAATSSSIAIKPPDFNGTVPKLLVKEGDSVITGAKLCILEAMKMENEITSPKNGTVTHIHIDSGDNVEKGNLLMEMSD